MAMDHGLDSRGSISGRAHSVQTGSGTHAASYPIQALAPGVKRPVREADDSHPSSTEI
jgi:hypothetical protein